MPEILIIPSYMGAFTVSGWTPEIGDPSLMGWFTVAAYYCTAILCVLCAKCAHKRLPPLFQKSHHLFWWIAAVFLLALGINKQLDFQSLLTVIGRDIAQSGGWYHSRRAIQQLFVLLLAISSLFIGFAFFLNYRGVWKNNRLACIGIAFLLVFVVVRAASFHYVDVLIGVRIAGFRVNWILELGGIFCILLSALSKLYDYFKYVRIKF